MKYAITGHTRGIGRRAFEMLSPNVIGFSKSTGYDITLLESRQRIVAEARDCDVFINNATEGFGQTQMFLDMLDAWENDPSKTIVNVGSRIAELIALPESHRHLRQYHAEKITLKQTSIRYSSNVKCKVVYRWFAYVGTEAILAKYPHFKEGDYITEDEAVKIILS